MWRKLLTMLSVMMLSAAISSAQQLSTLGPSGGPGGTQFTDGVVGGSWPAEIQVRSGAYIDAVQVLFKSTLTNEMRKGDRHGGDGGKLQTLKLQDDEYIVKILGTYDKFVESLTIVTNKERIFECGTKIKGKAEFFYSTPKGFMIYQFWGRSGVYVDAIGVEISPVPDSKKKTEDGNG